MPMHDWTRVTPNSFHAFHVAWVASLQYVLNRGVLPKGYYALAEQTSPPIGPDVLTLQRPVEATNGMTSFGGGGTALAVRKPKVRFTVHGAERSDRPSRRVAIRHNSHHRLVALIEIVSPGNKSAAKPFREFTEKLLGALRQGLHCLIVDPLPPSVRDPEGVHSAIWSRLVGGEIPAAGPRDRCLTSIEVRNGFTAYLESVPVGRRLPSMPLFLEPGQYVSVPLETSYKAAWDGLPDEIQSQL